MKPLLAPVRAQFLKTQNTADLAGANPVPGLHLQPIRE
jgi:hypothetical protein